MYVSFFIKLYNFFSLFAGVSVFRQSNRKITKKI